MGIITLVLIAAGTQAPGSGPQFWVIAACAFAIAIGTYSGGWRIIRTMGSGLTDVKPAQGFAAESSTASAILASSHLGFALSTTQVASGSVIGSGMGRRGTSVRWGTAGRIAARLAPHPPGRRNHGGPYRPPGEDRRRWRCHRRRRRHRLRCCTCSCTRRSRMWDTTTPWKSKKPARPCGSARRRSLPAVAPRRAEGRTVMKWLELVQVAGATLVAAVTVVVLYSLGVRLTAIAGDVSERKPAWLRPLAYVCFGLVRPRRAVRALPDHPLLQQVAGNAARGAAARRDGQPGREWLGWGHVWIPVLCGVIAGRIHRHRPTTTWTGCSSSTVSTAARKATTPSWRMSAAS